MDVALLLWRTIRIQRYRMQQTAKPQQPGEMTLGTVLKAGIGAEARPGYRRLNPGPRRTER